MVDFKRGVEKTKDSVSSRDRTFEFGTLFDALPPHPPPELFRATNSDFLPAELKPLGHSSSGQLRVAS